MSNIKDVAKRAGVGIATVSRVINGNGSVSTSARVRVEKAIEEIGYTANPIARGLKNVQTHTLAVIISSVSHAFFAQILKGISKVAEKYGYSVLIAETNGSMETEKKLINSFATQWVDGIILSTVAFGDSLDVREYCEQLGSLEKHGVRIPVVTLEYPCESEHVGAVVVDHKKAAVTAVEHLISLGRRNILHFAIPLSSYTGFNRCQGYREALQAHGLPVREDMMIEGNHTTHIGYTIMKKLLEAGKTIDGVFAANDRMAVGVILACREHGMRIPEDIAIIGMGNVFVSSIVTPTLSSIDIPQYEMGASAMELLHQQLEGKKTEKRQIITLETRVVVRESTVADAHRSIDDLDW